jgi:hypothetical protein
MSAARPTDTLIIGAFGDIDKAPRHVEEIP